MYQSPLVGARRIGLVTCGPDHRTRAFPLEAAGFAPPAPWRSPMRNGPRFSVPSTLVSSVVTALGAAVAATAQVAPHPPEGPPPSLKTVAVPEPPNFGDFVRNKAAAIALGKALFWDTQVGSDGRVACASCHFQ